MPLPAIERFGELLVVRDDRTPGGTKARILPALYDAWPEQEIVYAGPAEGYAQVAMGYAAAATGKRSTYFVAKRKTPHARTIEAIVAGANVIPVDNGRLSVVRARARDYAEQHDARFVALGFDSPEAVELVAAVARSLLFTPMEVWCVAGTGLLARGLQKAWPRAEHHAVQIGRAPDVGNAKLWQAPESFAQEARMRPPFPSCSNYDAKAWQFLTEHARPGALFWNVAA